MNMAVLDDDLVGLNATRIRDRPLAIDTDQSRRIAEASNDTSISIAGMRHSQGGHTVFPDGRMLLTTAAFNRIVSLTEVSGQAYDALIEVEAGATWEELHRILWPHGLAPMVQQSSAHFSVGGSLSVNCHGRDPRWGPISSSVEDVTVLTGTGEVLTASRTLHRDLFCATLGGYGACGQIVKATLRAVANSHLEYVGDWLPRDIDDYVEHANALLSKTDVHLHYAWLCCVRGRFYEDVLIADLVVNPAYQPTFLQSLKEQDWGDEEILRAGWAAARKDPGKMRAAVWKQLTHLHRQGGVGGKGYIDRRSNWLRSSVSFAASRGDGASTDILQEYFVPIEKLTAMIDMLKELYADPKLHETNVLSTTLRLVGGDDETVLSYCPGGPRVCVAVHAAVATASLADGRDLHPNAKAGIRKAIRKACDLGGSYYLPYFRVADAAAFRAAYTGHAALQSAIDRYNPIVDNRHRYWNRFLADYFS
jgi:decaprenylphospho-beta-D-ribofuranose 2-oxidase